jgi:hypothetical protein
MSSKDQQYTGRLYTQAEVDRMLREAKLSVLDELVADLHNRIDQLPEYEPLEDGWQHYGEYIIPPSWKKIKGVYIWFEEMRKENGEWSGVKGYVFKTGKNEYVAPFRGKLLRVVKDARDEFYELSKGDV